MKEQKIAEQIFRELKSQSACSISELLTDFSKGEIGVLGYLTFERDQVTSGELSEKLNVTTARMSSILNALEKKGYVKRQSDLLDKRKTFIFITEKGKIIVKKTKEEVLQTIQYVISELGIEDTKEYMRLATKIKDILKRK